MLDTKPVARGFSQTATPYKRKLIEVALPLQAINKASAREKSIRHGHPSTLHLWWARRPLAACRAVLFASLVDDPSSNPEQFPTAEDQERERKRLFDFIEQLVQWENSLDERVLSQAREEIRKSIGDDLPTVYDPFCGGGAIPIEAQRLGLPTVASDLNPVAVLITKGLTEIPWRFKGCAPVHPAYRGPLVQRTWERATGLAADVEAYGSWVLEEALRRIGSFYPTISLPTGRQATVIAWLWARTVHCPNPLCGAEMPLIKSFALSTKSGKEWSIEPIVDRAAKSVSYGIRLGKPSRDGTVDRRGAQCIVCNEPVTLAYIRSEGKAGRIGSQMIAIVAEGQRGRIYLAANDEHVKIARSAAPAWAPDTDLPERALGFRVQGYGMTKHRDLFTSRQLLALTTFSDLVRECRDRVLADAMATRSETDSASLGSDRDRAAEYAAAVITYLALGVGRLSDICNAFCRWESSKTQVRNLFGRNAVSMLWDFAEPNVFSGTAGDYGVSLNNLSRALRSASASQQATVAQRDATALVLDKSRYLFVTDPPYYDNVPYADLSDVFYVWLRPTLHDVYPELFETLLVPKVQELVADPARFGNSRKRARQFFERGLTAAFSSIEGACLRHAPTTILYAFKQTEGDGSDERGESSAPTSVGWEAMLQALLSAKFEIVGTWPMRSGLANRMRGQESNALASSIAFVCRSRLAPLDRCSRADFLQELRTTLPLAVKQLRDASLAATDLEQAALGPGMAIFSQYASVLEPDGTTMSVRSALALINHELARILLGEIADVDRETHFALSWFDSHSYEKGSYGGDAEVLLKAKNATLDALRASGVITADRGIVRLHRPLEVAVNSGSPSDREIVSMPVWAKLIHTIAALTAADGGEAAAARILRHVGTSNAETIKSIAYHCYIACNRLKRSVEAQDFNALVTAWPELERRSREEVEQRLF